MYCCADEDNTTTGAGNWGFRNNSLVTWHSEGGADLRLTSFAVCLVLRSRFDKMWKSGFYSIVRTEYIDVHYGLEGVAR